MDLAHGTLIKLQNIAGKGYVSQDIVLNVA